MTRLIIIVALSAGCSATSPYRSPTALGKGTTELLVAPQVHAAGPSDAGKAPYPELALGARHGVTDEVDAMGTMTVLALGEALSSFGLEGGGRVQIRDGERVDIGIGASAGYKIGTSSGAVFESVHVALPVSFGIRLGKHQLIWAPNVSWQRWYSMGTNPVDIPAAGSSLGFEWKVNERYTILPELGWSISPVELANFDRTVLVHFGIALTQRR